jgi:Zincin-like metallopeptidase
MVGLVSVFGVRTGRRRDRRGRGMRGPLALPGPLSPAGVALHPGRARAFDELVRLSVERLRAHLPGELDAVQFGVEETPVLPDDWTGEVPLGTHVAAGRGRSARIVVYRLPVKQRARAAADMAALVLDVLVDEVASLLGHDPDTVDPRGI